MRKEKQKKIIKIVDIIPPSRKEGGYVEPEPKPEPIPEPEAKEKPQPEIEFEPEPEPEPKPEKLPPEPKPETKPEPEPKPEKLSKEPELKPDEEEIFSPGLFPAKKPKNKKKIFVVAGIIGLIVLGFVIYFTLAKAKVILSPKTETMEFQTILNIDKDIAFIDLDSNTIPAQPFQITKEKEKEFPATKEKQVSEKATGTITVYNQYSSAPQTLVETTRFVSEKGKMFRTIKTITVPGAEVEEGKIIPSSIDVEVIAAEPGEEYNIKPSSFTIPGFKGTPKHEGFYGESSKAMSGGVVGKVKVASQEDIQGAKEVVIAELTNEAKQELEKSIPSDLKVIEDTILIETTESSSNVEPDQPAEKFTVKIKVAAKTIGFKQEDAISLINNNLKTKIEENKTLVPETIEISYSLTDINLDQGTAKLSCKIKEDIAWKINTEEIKTQLAGKKEIEVRQYLSSLPEIKKAKVIFWPFWVKKIPKDQNKVEVIVETLDEN